MDFCNEALGTTVTSSQVASDGHEVENLISADPIRRRKGFLVERFIKPPVEVNLTFPCAVNISFVTLLTSVGSQKSIGIDLLGINKAGEHVLGKCYLKSENKICFLNSCFQNRPPFPEAAAPHPCQTTMQRSMKALNGISCLKIRIWRTQNGSLVAIGHVDVHAIPASSVGAHIIKRLLALVLPEQAEFSKKTIKRKQKSASLSSRSKDSSEACKSSTKLSGDNAELCTNNVKSSDHQVVVGGPLDEEHDEVVPEEFIDALTCEIMTFPVILPSGNTIDKVSLDRHIAAELEWGRAPSDPFTGINFSAGKQPLPNTHLKARIDQFIMRKEWLVSGRTVGKRKCAEAFRENDSNLKSAKLEKMEVLSTSRNNGECTSLTVTELQQDGLPVSHEMQLNRSLEMGLRSALGSLTSYTTISSNSNTDRWQKIFKTPEGCAWCSASDLAAVVYRLPCSHLICRGCTSTLSLEKFCYKCKKRFSTDSLLRVHR